MAARGGRARGNRGAPHGPPETRARRGEGTEGREREDRGGGGKHPGGNNNERKEKTEKEAKRTQEGKKNKQGTPTEDSRN